MNNVRLHRAFTLIELLVVIAIIAILAAILFPVFAQAKEAAKKTQDLSNTKQQATASFLYMGDSDDTYPRMVYTSNVNLWGWQTPTTWREVLLPYVKNGISKYVDGAKSKDFAQGGLWSTPARPNDRGVYGANNNLFAGNCQWDNAAGSSRCDQNADGTPNGKAPFPSVSATELDAPAQTAATWTTGINPAWGASGDAPDGSPYWWGGGNWPPKFNAKEGGEKWDADKDEWPYWAMPRYRYAGGLNAGFADGHAKFVKKGAFNWCRHIYVKGHTTNWNDNWDGLFSPGQPCAAYAR